MTLITNGYVGLNALKWRELTTQQSGSATTDTTRDAVMSGCINAASRVIDGWCGRVFYTSVDTREFTSPGDGYVGVADLVSVTSLATDISGDRTYGTTWATTDYDLEPYNARSRTPAEPYSIIRQAPRGLYAMPTTRKGIQIVGGWGYSDETASTSTLTSGVNASVTTWPVADGTAFDIGNILLCGTEQAYVDGISSNNLTVRRGVNGTTAASHSGGDAVYVYQFGAIGEAATLYAQRLFRRRVSVLGIQGSAPTGQVTMTIPVDKDIELMLAPYKRISM